MEDGFEDLPETFNQMMLLPNVPNFCTAHCDCAKVHQIIAARRTLLKKEEYDGTKSWTVTVDSARRHVNAPCGIMQNQRFFPLRGILFFPINRFSTGHFYKPFGDQQLRGWLIVYFLER